MDYVRRFQIAARRDRCAADLDRANCVALLLDFWAAFAAYGAGNSAAKLQIVIRSVDDGIHPHLGEVTFKDFYSIVYKHGGWVR
jgi:hypothetical protein